jgi:hypothetical protein
MLSAENNYVVMRVVDWHREEVPKPHNSRGQTYHFALDGVHQEGQLINSRQEDN